MAKNRTFFRCTECGYETAKWMGKCPSCNNWNTLTEQAAEKAPSTAAKGRASFSKAQVSQLASIVPGENSRTKTGIDELDRVLGGGIVRGSVVLAGGEPGIGKSTLFLQAADLLSK